LFSNVYFIFAKHFSSNRFYHYILELYFSLKQNAADAIQGLNGKLALSKPLIVNWAKKQTGRTVRIITKLTVSAMKHITYQ